MTDEKKKTDDTGAEPTPMASADPSYVPGEYEGPAPEDHPAEARMTPPDEQINPHAATSVGRLIRDGEPVSEEEGKAETKAATTTSKSAAK